MSKLTIFNSELFSQQTHKKRQNLQRLRQLSQPRLKESTEDQVSPCSYYPTDSFLSTKSRSPMPVTCKSTRFNLKKLPPLSILERKHENSVTDSKLLSPSNSPCFTFKRTGHDLKLVNNPSFPGVGKYSPRTDIIDKGYYFAKAPRDFNWKKISIDKLKFKNFDDYLLFIYINAVIYKLLALEILC